MPDGDREPNKMLAGLQNPEVGGVLVRRGVVSCVDVANFFYEVGNIQGGGAVSCVDFLIVEERIIMDSALVSNTNILVSI